VSTLAEALKFESPPYVALIPCAPTLRLEVVKVATPALSAAGPPTFVPSISNWTVPVGVPAGEVTVAVKVTLCPKAEGFAEDETTVVVFAFAMLKERATSDAAL
jgi:hypothetical protein